MNKYLIVVFCVLTGCAVVVPYSECEAQNVNAQLLADWYADHGDIQDDSYAIHYILRQEVSTQKMSIQPVIAGKIQLVKNIPSLPDFLPDDEHSWLPLCFMVVELEDQHFISPLSQKCGRALNIRAPSYC